MARLNEALYLLTEEKVPIATVSRRLRLRRGVLVALLAKGEVDVSLLKRKPSRGPLFQKFHQRAAETLEHLLTTADHPLLLRKIQAELVRKTGLRVSRSHLGRYLRERLGATFRLLKPITVIQNKPAAMLQC